MSKQTAVEWLLWELTKVGYLPDGLPEAIHNKAKAMEWEQRFKDFQGGFQAATDAIIGANRSVQSKTYGKEASHEEHS